MSDRTPSAANRPHCERPPWHPDCYWPNCKCDQKSSAACDHDGCDCIEEEAPCGCKWYVDGTVYKCLSHRTSSAATASPRESWRFRCAVCGHGRDLYGWSQAVAYGPVAADGLVDRHEDVEDCFIFEDSLQCRVHPEAQIETKVNGRFCVWKRCEGLCGGEHENLRKRGYYSTCPDCEGKGGHWVLPEREAVA